MTDFSRFAPPGWDSPEAWGSAGSAERNVTIVSGAGGQVVEMRFGLGRSKPSRTT